MSKSFKIIDSVLNETINKNIFHFHKIKPMYSAPECIEAYSLMVEYRLINIMNPKEPRAKQAFTISTKGLRMIEDFDSFESFYNEKIDAENQALDIQRELNEKRLELVESTIKEFPKTKITSRISLAIAIVLAILKIIEWIKERMPIVD